MWADVGLQVARIRPSTWERGTNPRAGSICLIMQVRQQAGGRSSLLSITLATARLLCLFHFIQFYFELQVLFLFTVKKAERDAGPKHEGGGKFHQPRRTIGKIRQHQRLGLSIYKGDGIFRHPCVVVLRHAWLF
jgi:hypothetical protein